MVCSCHSRLSTVFGGRAAQALNNKTLAAEYYQHAMNLNKLTNELEEKDIRERLYELFD